MYHRLESTRYTMAYENGDLIRRGITRIGGHEVKTWSNLSRATDVNPTSAGRAVMEAARALHTDFETVRQTLLKNLMTERVVSYTVDPKRREIKVSAMPILTRNN